MALGRADAGALGGIDSPARALYAAGTWGPSASSAMIARDGFCWSEES